ncbi:hypothetical protein KIV40_20270 [Vibrio sp. D173a]|uniref:hypothetical protein n=1 Tax=Vibrio sp. D173a TaxID=2836349 RepID=UPI0025564698|nr:hypothetical protein [Vibrio sp. D173a]MDK9757666.1 hypothetical protein [Vibrio sp. D173a]
MCEDIFIKNGLSESGDQAEYMDVFYAINNGPWIPVDKLDNKGQYFSGLFYHEVKVWDRNKGEIFDLKVGGVGMGFGEAVSIKFTRC